MKGIVAVEPLESGLMIFCHDERGSFRQETIPFSPWCLTTGDAELPPDGKQIVLAGDLPLKFRVEFDDRTAYEAAMEKWGREPGVFRIRDLTQQALSSTGLRLFAGMDFYELRRMQISVIPDNGGKIGAIEFCTPGGEFQRLSCELAGGEAAVLQGFNAAVIKYDPDVLEGYDFTRNELPLLLKRAEKLDIQFSCGRDGKGFSMRSGRFSAAEKQIYYNRFSLFGRHVLDLMHPAVIYDVSHRDFESFELSCLREYFHLDSTGTVETIRLLGDLLLPPWFYRTGGLPLNFQDCVVRGSGSVLDALFIAEYRQAGHSLPFPETSRSFTGALTGVGKSGVFHNVRHCDVRSLYPSILLYLGQGPSRDELGIFLKYLRELRHFRLEAKDRARSAVDPAEKERFEALQSSFKVLINSFYGYLGFPQGCFNDYALAEKVTATGRELLQKLVSRIGELGGTMVEMDTDGIYFCMPDEMVADFDGKVQEVLPPGIELDFDAEYSAMYCYKSKNYALLHGDGAISVSGAAFKARSLENYQRRFLRGMIESKLRGKPEKLENIYHELRDSIADKSIDLGDLAKSEVLSDSPESYRRKQSQPGARRSAPYELALASGQRFRAGDRVRFYMTGNKAKVPVVGNSKLLSDADMNNRDENSAYYLAKLDELYKTFA